MKFNMADIAGGAKKALGPFWSLMTSLTLLLYQPFVNPLLMEYCHRGS